jgi:hypothetical protein
MEEEEAIEQGSEYSDSDDSASVKKQSKKVVKATKKDARVTRKYDVPQANSQGGKLQ